MSAEEERELRALRLGAAKTQSELTVALEQLKTAQETVKLQDFRLTETLGKAQRSHDKVIQRCKSLRIVRSGFGTARQKVVLE